MRARVWVGAALAVTMPVCLPAGATAAPRYPSIQVLSVRADLVSGGEALTAIVLPRGTRARSVRVWLDGRIVTKRFARRPNGRFEGLVKGLKLGKNLLSVVLPGGGGAEITITDHRLGGPVFAGPQPTPWTCEAGATDRKCDKRVQYSWLYLPRGKTALAPYDPNHPPSDVATTTTDAGVTVPFIVREELGYEDRDQYRIEVLYQRGKRWAPWAPQRQWDHKVLIMHGFDCHDTYGVTSAPFSDGATSTLGLNTGLEDSSTAALGMGFAVMSTALDDSAANCNPALQAESILMAKEHLIDRYGEIAYTIGTGCSGGSLAEQWMENAYPGLYQGLIPQCSFPDAGSSGQQIVDYEALGNYFEAATKSNPLAWTQSQEAEVEGTAVENLPISNFDATFSAQSFFPFAVPTNCTDYADGDSYISSQEVYNAQANPGGVRCGILDWDINLLAPQPKSVWDAQELELGRGFAGMPIGNVGVQYGLSALQQGQISPAQFVDLNAKVGGFNIDWNPTSKRLTPDEPALANAYRTGIINEANNLASVPIINLTGPNDPGLAHDSYRAFAMRARLIREHGTGANMVIWEGPAPIIGDIDYTVQALAAMNRWVAAIERDHSAKRLAAKVIDDKPADIHDQCSNGNGTKVSNSLCPQAVVPVYGTPRTVAGEPITTDQNQCQLKPLERSAYNVSFTNAQWSELQGIFPSGVCDYSKPGVSQQATVAWMTYQTASGKVIYGGRPMGPVPRSRRCAVRKLSGHHPACAIHARR
jgi:Tannase-like family of unknown function (DUF6351)